MRRTYAAVAVAVAATLTIAAGMIQDATVRITVLFTSDLHGHILPYDYFSAQTAELGLAKVGTLIRRVREENPNTILLDGGDTIQGSPLLFYAQRVGESLPNPMMRAMNLLDYDAMVVGNHEFNYGLRVLRAAEEEAEFPFLSANIIDEITGERIFLPFEVIESAGVRIAVIGLTTPAIPSWEVPEHYAGLAFNDPVGMARVWVPSLRGPRNCDLVIALAHFGFEGDPENDEGFTNSEENMAYELATEIEGIDLLLTGHTHRLIEPRQIGGTFASTCPPYGRRIIRIDIDLESDGEGGWRVTGRSGRSIPVTEEIEPDPEVVAEVLEIHELTESYLNEVVGFASEPLTSENGLLRDTALADLLQTAQLEATQADVSFASLLIGERFEIPAGPITLRQVYALYRYEDQLLAVEADGETIRAALEHAARYYDGLELTPAGVLEVVTDQDIYPDCVDFAEGVSYRIDPTRPEGDRVRDLTFQGRPIRPEQTFNIAINSYRFAGGDGYDMFAGCPVVSRAELEVREIVIDYLRRRGTLEPSCSRNWYIAPDIMESQEVER